VDFSKRAAEPDQIDESIPTKTDEEGRIGYVMAI
jgi:hypothetical protein